MSSLINSTGSVLGLVGIMLLMLQLILGSRFIISRFTSNTVAVNKLHQKLGKYGVVFVLAHVATKTYVYSLPVILSPNANLADPFEVGVLLGKIAFLLFAIVWVTSAVLRSKLKYRPWLYIHYLAYPMLLLAMIHAGSIGTVLNTSPVLKGLWSSLIVISEIFLVYRLAKFLGFGKKEFVLTEKQLVGNDIFVFTFKTVSKMIFPKVGQYCYLQIKRFGESRPFTVMGMDFDENTLTFGVKALGTFTKETSKIAVGHKIYVDGPYGVFTREGHNELPKVMIAGGVGITPFIELIKKYSNKDTYLFFVNKTIEKAVYRAFLRKELGDKYWDVLSEDGIKGVNIIHGKLDVTIVKKLIPVEIIRDSNFFICGSPSFYKYYRDILITAGVLPAKFFYEEFGL